MSNPFDALTDWIELNEEQTRARRDRNVVELMNEGFRLVADALDTNYIVDPSAIHDATADEISGITEKTSPAGTDLLIIEDSAAGNVKKKLQISSLLNSSPTYIVATDIFDNVASAAVTPVSDIQTPFDGNELIFDEVSGTPGIDHSINFTGITSIRGLVLRAYYSGSGSHHVDVSFHNYTSGLEDTVIRLDDAPAHNYRTIFIPDDSDYISAGAAQVNIIHPDTGVPAHAGVTCDYVAILG